MQEEKWLTAAEIAEETGIPAPTISRYTKVHGLHLPVRREGRNIYFKAPKAIEILKEIRELYNSGKNSAQVEQLLAKKYETVIEVVEENKNQSLKMTAAEAFAAMTEQLKAMKQEMEKIKAGQQRLEKYIEERDRQLLEGIRRIQERYERQLEEASKPFWRRLFPAGPKK